MVGTAGATQFMIRESRTFTARSEWPSVNCKANKQNCSLLRCAFYKQCLRVALALPLKNSLCSTRLKLLLPPMQMRRRYAKSASCLLSSCSWVALLSATILERVRCWDRLNWWMQRMWRAALSELRRRRPSLFPLSRIVAWHAF